MKPQRHKGHKDTVVLRALCAFVVVLCFVPRATLADTLEEIRKRGNLRWGADLEGGAPYVFPDPANPRKSIGFEVDIANQIARRLGVSQTPVQTPWDEIPQALRRGDFDIALNGIEVTPIRGQFIDFTVPYYHFSESLMVRQSDQTTSRLEDLKGRKVGTLKGTLADEILRRIPEIRVVSYDGQVEPYKDLALGRLDGVLLDDPIARYYGEAVPGLRYAAKGIGSGEYAIGVRKGDARLLNQLNQILNSMQADGSLVSILKSWSLDQTSGQVTRRAYTASLWIYLPLLVRAAGMTLFLSIFSMTVAVAAGVLLCLGKTYGPVIIRSLASGYIEFFRGTPLLLQLLVIYFGFPVIGINLPAWIAAVLGLGLNYAAYEAEIYRGGIQSVPGGQMEAALSLGMPQSLAIRKVILPQALRVSLPASTNDFIALFKDSSLCSVIGVVELTKQFNILAVSTWRVMELGVMTAVLYLAMSYPLALVARRLEAMLRR
ncbi:MAG TPA: ABC transporter substrate-binding protein/permease [Acidobacteriota bacterium]|jgi:polar amino acid transport system substrate-binding protein